MSEDCHDIAVPFWEKQHIFKPKTFQDREQKACEICGQLILASVHSTVTAVPVEERTRTTPEKTLVSMDRGVIGLSRDGWKTEKTIDANKLWDLLASIPIPEERTAEMEDANENPTS